MVNLYALSRSELKNRTKFKCLHRHNGISHPECWNKQNGTIEKIAYLDIETSNLSSDFGVILSYVLGADGNYYKRVLTTQEIRGGIYDKKLCEELCRDIKEYNRVVTYYGSRFDIPFIRSRCVYWGLDFPVYKQLYHTDAYLTVKYKFGTLHSRRLGVVAPFFKIPAKKHSLNPEIWFKCMSGNEKALKFVLTHNIEDVVSLEKLWRKINRYTRLQKTSI